MSFNARTLTQCLVECGAGGQQAPVTPLLFLLPLLFTGVHMALPSVGAGNGNSGSQCSKHPHPLSHLPSPF